MNSDTHAKRMSLYETVAVFSAPGLSYIMEYGEASAYWETGASVFVSKTRQHVPSF